MILKAEVVACVCIMFSMLMKIHLPSSLMDLFDLHVWHQLKSLHDSVNTSIHTNQIAEDSQRRLYVIVTDDMDSPDLRTGLPSIAVKCGIISNEGQLSIKRSTEVSMHSAW